MASTLTQNENVGTLEISNKNGELELRQKVNEKREMDVKLIKLRQYLIFPFVEPLPTGAFARLEGNQIWEMVLEYMTSPFDIDSAQRTCPAFEDILLEKIPTAPPGEREVSAVLKIMRKGKYTGAWDDSPWHLRLVSKSWQRAADQALRAEFEGEWHLELDDEKWWNLCTDAFNVTKVTNVDLAWSVLENSSCRSSLLQIIRLDEGCMSEIGIFYPRILEFLDEYGELVKGLVVDWGVSTISVASKYLNLLSLIVRMPNLRALAVDVRIGSPDRHRPQEVAVDFKDLTLRYPFPSYVPLEVLSIQGYYHSMLDVAQIPIVTEILSKCNNLKSISIPEYILEKESVVRMLEGRYIEFIDCHMEHPQKILPLLSSLPLRKIVLPKYGDRNCSEFIGMLNLFGDTLEYLELPKMKFKFSEGGVALQLPKLKTLILESWPDPKSLDVLTPLSGLENLELLYNVYIRDYKTPKGKIRFVENQNSYRLEKSKIWTRFPNLSFVKIRVNVYDNVITVYYGSSYLRDYDSECGFQVICHYVKRGKEIRVEKVESYICEDWSSSSD